MKMQIHVALTDRRDAYTRYLPRHLPRHLPRYLLRYLGKPIVAGALGMQPPNPEAFLLHLDISVIEIPRPHPSFVGKVVIYQVLVTELNRIVTEKHFSLVSLDM